MNHQAYLDDLQRQLASAYAEGLASDDPLEGCKLHDGGLCPLLAHLPSAIQAIHSVESPWMEDYLAAVQDRVFGLWTAHEQSLPCPLSREGDCALARTLVLLVRSLDEAGR
jgi:hypothetical protein